MKEIGSEEGARMAEKYLEKGMKKSNINQMGSSMGSSHDLIDAKLEEHQLCGSKHCPSCGHKLEGKPVRVFV